MATVSTLFQRLRKGPKDDPDIAATNVPSHIFHEDHDFRDAQNALYELLRPICAAKGHDEAIIYLAFREANFIEPLNKYEVMTLACALYAARADQEFINYADVLQITDRLNGKPMNTTLVYRSLARLSTRGLIVDAGREPDIRSGRPSQGFKITPAGRTALRLAVLNAYHLAKSRNSDAA